jgi:signal transduction histidine kinase/ActR/RegA family two-component response regulator
MRFSSSKGPRPLSHYQVALVLLAVLPLIAVFAVIAWRQSEALRETIDHGMLRAADALSLAVDREIGTIRSSLETLANSDAIDRRDIETFYREASRTAAKWPGSWIVLAEPTGQYLVNTSLAFGTPLPNRFREEPAVATGELRPGVAPYLKQVFATGRANNSQLFRSIAHDRAVVAVNVPVLRENQLRYVLSITLPPQELTDLVKAGLYDAEGSAVLIDANGRVITRSKDADKHLGQRAAPGIAVASDAPPRGLGTGTALSGEEVYRAYVRSNVTGWIVSTGIARSVLDRRVAADLSRTVLVGIGGLVIGVLLALWFANRLRDPLAALAAKASGHAAAAMPKGFMPAEFNEIARGIEAGERAREAQAAERDLRVAAEVRKDEADAANRAKDQFLAMLGHELRNPLAAISNAVTVMEQSPATVGAMTPLVKRQSEHLRKIVDDLLDVARVTSGKFRLMPENLDLHELAAACVDNFVRTGRSAHHDLTVRGHSVLVHADRHRMTQVLTNLIDNALKFTPSGGRIDVSVSAAGGEAVLRVEDTGSGIPRESLKRIFDVFAQGEQPLERAQSGLGLGLALAKSLVEAQHGRIEATSEGAGKGAAFTVRLTRVQPEHKQDAAGMRENAGPVKSKRVLLVEDKADTRRALRGLLELDGHDVTEAPDGTSAIDRAHAAAPDVAIVDIGLPDISGYEVARTFRSDSALCGIRLVALTGFGMPEDREKALRAGFDDFVIKPIEIPMLRKAIASKASQE